MVIAIGIRNCACRLVSKSSGVRPPMVVAEVRITARSRSQAPSTMASCVACPSRNRSSMVVTRMIESLTMMPESPISATRLRIVRS